MLRRKLRRRKRRYFIDSFPFQLSIQIKFQVEKLLGEREKSIIRARKMAETSAKLRELIKTVNSEMQ